MNDFTKLPVIGIPTDNETKLIDFIGNHLADYIEKHGTKRHELMALLSWLAKIMFTNQTSLNAREQGQEIDDFCKWLKGEVK